jgi:hypothetical protein
MLTPARYTEAVELIENINLAIASLKEQYTELADFTDNGEFDEALEAFEGINDLEEFEIADADSDEIV